MKKIKKRSHDKRIREAKIIETRIVSIFKGISNIETRFDRIATESKLLHHSRGITMNVAKSLMQ